MKKIFLLICSLVLSITGCSQNVYSFSTFSIQGFDDFYNFRTTDDVRETYIREGKIEFARVDNLYVCPFIKEINYDECGLFFYVYALDAGSAETITICNIVLSALEDNVCVYTSSNEQTITLEKNDGNILLGTMTGISFKKSDTWLLSGNTLNLSFQATVGTEEVVETVFSYDIRIIRNKRAKMIT